ncbi:MAG TPA: S8 family serine peptidase, partial [Bacillales bacterium]
MRYSLLFALVFLLALPQTAFGFAGEGESPGSAALNKLNRGEFVQHRGLGAAETKRFEQVDLDKVNGRRIIVKLKDAEAFQPSDFDVKLEKTSDSMKKNQLRVVQVPGNVNFQGALAKLRNNSNVVYAEPDYIREVENYNPNDPKISRQWYLDAIHMFEAWDITKGSSAITVAVLDTGVDANHQDLKGHVLPGYDFVNHDSNPADDNGHGTHVAGIIAAQTNNGKGVAGVSFNTKILPVKVANERGIIVSTDAVSGIYYAIRHGADVINMSYGSVVPTQAELDALWAAYNKGIVLVAASGNSGTRELEFPASYYPVISVAATDRAGQQAGFSTWGPAVDIAAPGVDIFSTDITGNPGYSNGNYADGSGTSFSTPIISSLAALLKSEHPKWGPGQIEWALELGAKKASGTNWDSYLGYGSVNATNVLAMNLPSLKGDVSGSEANALSLTNGKTYAEKIDMPGDQDWYRINVGRCGKLTIQLSGASRPNDLYGVLGERLSDGRIYYQNLMNDKGIGGTETYTFQTGPGTYFLLVSDWNNHWSSKTYNIIRSLKTTDRLMTFPDTRNHWAKKEISYLAKCGMLNGFPDGSFDPNGEVTRAQAAKIIAEELNLAPANSTFPDVSDSRWYASYVGAVEKAGIISGYPDGTFRPKDSLTRAAMAKILVEAYHLKGTSSKVFKDVDKGMWAVSYIRTLVANGITKGYP